MATSRELKQKLGEMVTASRAIIDRADSEKRKRTAEEDAELAKYDAEMDQIQKDADTLEKVERRERAAAQPINEPASRPDIRAGKGDDETRQIETEKEFRDRFGAMGEHIAKRIPNNPLASRQYRQAFSRWLTAPKGSGVNTLSPEEQRALSQGTNSEGGFTVPQEQFIAELIKQMDNESVIRGLARTFQVPQSQSIGAPTLSADPADNDWTSELLVGSEDSTMAFGKREMRPWPLAKYIKVSDKLLRASPLGMESIVRARLAYKQAVAHSTAFNTGSGANQPLGLYTASTSGISTGRDVDVSATNAYSADGFISARYTLRSGYWPNARWHMHRNMLAQVRKLKSALDQGGNYLWQPGLTVGAPNTFLDFPYVVDEYAPSTVTGITSQYVAILGDFSNYWIVDALDIRLQRLDELFALTNQVGFVIRSETDGQPVLEDAFVRCKATIS